MATNFFGETEYRVVNQGDTAISRGFSGCAALIDVNKSGSVQVTHAVPEIDNQTTDQYLLSLPVFLILNHLFQTPKDLNPQLLVVAFQTTTCSWPVLDNTLKAVNKGVPIVIQEPNADSGNFNSSNRQLDSVNEIIANWSSSLWQSLLIFNIPLIEDSDNLFNLVLMHQRDRLIIDIETSKNSTLFGKPPTSRQRYSHHFKTGKTIQTFPNL